jgi:hypothetical protein
MSTDRSSVGTGELVATAGGLVLLLLLFVLKWYGPGAITVTQQVSGTINGWHGLIHLRWLLLVTIAASLLLLVIAAVGSGPGVRLLFSVIVLALGVVSFLWLGYRVLISVPPHEKPAAYLGLLCTLAISVGAGWALRDALAAR